MKKLTYIFITIFTIILGVMPFYLKDTTQACTIVTPEPISIYNEIPEEIIITPVELTNEPVDISVATEEVSLRKYKNILSLLGESSYTEQEYSNYKDILFMYMNTFNKTETIFDIFTEEELQLIYRTVETEVYDKDFISKVNVANVIFNRYDSEDYGDITNIITSPNQFAYHRTEITDDTVLAVIYAFEMEDTTNGCLGFRSGYKPEIWKISSYCTWYKQFEDKAGHAFYNNITP